ncbi:MAG TPA: hypothetical protein VF753_10910 [Terriglobales bacterium]
MVPEKQIDDFVSRLKQAAGDNLQSVTLYGSAAAGEFHADFSNVNLLCILQETSFAALNTIAPAVKWWMQQKHHEPLFLTREELEHSTDVFSIEYLDMQQRHKVLYGDDPLSGLAIPMQLHRAQVEYELRTKLIMLRERLVLVAGDNDAQWELMLKSASTFITLFRHTLIALGATAPGSKRETVKALAAKLQFDATAFYRLLDIREHKAERKQFDLADTFTNYLRIVQHVTAAVDKMLDSPAES